MISRSSPTLRSSAHPSSFCASASKKRAALGDAAFNRATLLGNLHSDQVLPRARRSVGCERRDRAGQSHQTGSSLGIKRLALIRHGCEDQMILRLLHGFHAEGTEREQARAADQRLDAADLADMFAIVETDLGGRKVAALGPLIAQSRGRDDEDPTPAFRPALRQCEPGLDGLAEAHFFVEQRTFKIRAMQRQKGRHRPGAG